MKMEIRPLDREALKPDNGLAAQRLLPWPLLNAPFEGSWCVVAPGAESGAHAHHEHEIWIAMTGSADLLVDGDRIPFRRGDIVHFVPGQGHQVVNSGDEDFEMYAIWWDKEMAAHFTERAAADASSVATA
ncbi:cupin domain-containing protein [Streptomyces sp. NPDC051664]|uniref:cupin domain-containing protein n=1 Tax=Streptomyces sp. NPDC051664 TaxID=3365668 RepID=UPI0037A701B9